MAYLAVALGGALGAMSRFWVYNVLFRGADKSFPYATLFINVLGSFLLAVVFVLLVERSGLDPVWRTFTSVGFIGAFTTFSTFSLETVAMLEQGQLWSALSYIISSLVLCVLVAWLGLFITRQLI